MSIVLATHRHFPHVRAEWLPELLAGEHHCEWAAWVKARHPDRIAPPSSSDEDADPEHAGLLDQQKADWAERGYSVATDSDTAFLLRGRNAVLTGAPDIIVHRDDHTLVISPHRPATSFPRHPGPHLHVRPPEGARPIPRHGAARRAGVPRQNRVGAEGRRRPGPDPAPRRPHQQGRVRQARRPRAKRPRMRVLRHQG